MNGYESRWIRNAMTYSRYQSVWCKNEWIQEEQSRRRVVVGQKTLKKIQEREGNITTRLLFIKLHHAKNICTCHKVLMQYL